MHALTLWPEWAAAITCLGKDVENRGWSPPSLLIGARFAIHAGKHIGGRLGAASESRGLAAVVEMAGRAPGWQGPRAAQIQTSAIVATARLVCVVRDHVSSWAVPGSFHWVLAEVRALAEPVPFAGRQGLWELPRDVCKRVVAQEREVAPNGEAERLRGNW